MSLASAVNEAIIAAKAGLGDLVISAIHKKVTSKTYNAAAGKYEAVTTDIAVEGVADTFSFVEQQALDFNQSDVKFSVFNPGNDLEFSTEDKFVLYDVEMQIIRIHFVYVGGFRPMITLVLRK